MSARPDDTASPDGRRPSSRARRRDDERAGSLVLIGGACDPVGEALGVFLELAGAGDGGLIVGLTTASVDPGGSALAWKDDFARAGADNVEFPIVDRRARAQDQRIADLVLQAKGIFLGGGDQVTLISTLGGSRVWRAIKEAHARGAVVAGTSAGAAALSETVLAGGEMDETGEPVALHLGSGLGLLGFSSVVDTHFSKRGRLQRLFRQVAENPELLGLGIDEDTAMVVNGHLARVVGRGSVTYVDARGVRFDNAEDVAKQGVPLTLSYLRVGIIGAGYEFNLRERELELLLDETREAVETPIVKGRASGGGDAGGAPASRRAAEP